ncbi:MAG: YybS family protein [Heyndrickxia sp.]
MKNVRVITEGAMLLAVYIVLLLVYLYIPVIYIISAMFLVLPFLLYSAKHPFKYSLVFLVASLIISALIGTVFSLPISLIFGTTGIVMGYCVKINKSKFVILVVSSITFIIDILLGYMVAIKFFHMNFLQETIKVIRESFQQSAEILKSLGQTQADQVTSQLDNILTLFQTMFPTLLVISSFVVVWLFMIINFPIARRFGVNVPKWEPFHKIQLPKSVLWYYLITMVLSLLFHPKSGGYIAVALLNLAFIFQVLMLIQGFSLIYYFGHIYKWSKGILALITVVAFVFSPSMFIILILGIIDLGMEIRSKLKG